MTNTDIDTDTEVDTTPQPRLTRTIDEAAAMLGISRSLAYEMVARGEIPSIRLGKRKLIPLAALENLLSV